MQTPEATRAHSRVAFRYAGQKLFFSGRKKILADGIFVSPDGIVGTMSPMPHSNSLFESFKWSERRKEIIPLPPKKLFG